MFILVDWWIGGLLFLGLIENTKCSLSLNHDRFSFNRGCENGLYVRGYEARKCAKLTAVAIDFSAFFSLLVTLLLCLTVLALSLTRCAAI